MASRDQSYKAGEAKGHTQEKTGRAAEAVKEKTQEAKDMAAGGAEAARDRACEATEATKEKAGQMAESGKETAETGKEKTGGFLQQTGEQVKGMATGAAEAAKHAFGMAEEEDDKKRGY